MFARLITLAFSLLVLSAAVAKEPMQFRNVESAKIWFSENYPVYTLKKEILKISKNQDVEVFAFYGAKGSGIIQMDGWFYSCFQESICDLIGMMDLGESRQQKDFPKITFENSVLIINSDGNRVLRININEK